MPWGIRAVVLASALAAPLSVAAAQGAAPASGEDPREYAKQRFEQGVADYDAARYEQALANFQEAYRVRPHPLVNVNIANCYDKLHKPLQALFHFRRFLESDAGTPEQRAEVGQAVERLRKQVGQLLLRITPDGATVIIDDGDQRRAPLLDPVQLEAGKHELEVRLEGYKPLRRSVTVRGGITLELNLALERAGEVDDHHGRMLSVTPVPEPTDAPAPAEPAPAADPESESASGAELELDRDRGEPAQPAGLPASVWVAGAVTASLAVTALVTGVLALSADSEFEADRARLALAATPAERVAVYAEARDHADRAEALALTTDILLLAAGAGAAVTAYLALTRSEPGDKALTLAPALAQGGGGVAVSSAF